MAKRPQAQSLAQSQTAYARWRARLPLLAGLLALAGVLVATVVWLLEPQHLPLRTVRVEGTLAHVTPAEIRGAVAPYAKQGFLHIDIVAVRAALERLPWIYSAQVTRSWPDALRVTVQEQKVLARWADGGLVNVEGELFQPPQAVTEPGLPVLQGPPGTSAMLAEHLVTLQQTLAPLSLAVAKVTMDERRAWSLTLKDGVELVLGRSDHIARLQRFVLAYPRVLEPRIATVARVDLRYTNGFAVQWRSHDGDQSGHAGA